MRPRPAQQQQPWSLLLPALLLAAWTCAAAQVPDAAAGLHGTRSARKVLLQVQSSGPGPPPDGVLTGVHAFPC
jgi:hypothetical protein